MKSNKGFTLIELLAVIVILAIIALIATPTILGVIETARQGSAKSSALGYIDSVEKQVAIDMLETDSSKITSGLSVPTTGTQTFAVSTIKVDVKGTAPKSGKVVLDSNGSATTGTCLNVELNNKTYYVSYANNTASIASTECSNS